MQSGNRCSCLSRGWELSSLPRPRILGTFANGWSSRLVASARRTCKSQLIRTETGIVLAADDQAYRTDHPARCRVVAPQEIGIRGPIGRFSYANEIWFGSNWISAHGNCHVLPTPVPTYGHGLLRPHHREGNLFSKLNHLRSGWVWHQPCLIQNVIAKPQRNPFMMGAASRSLPEPPAREYVGRVFSQHREELEWLANFLTGDETIAAACLVDACALAESENPGFQEWIL